MKAKVKMLVALISWLVTLLAMTNVCSACGNILYQPKVPKYLTEK